jgi:hypothetical protein
LVGVVDVDVGANRAEISCSLGVRRGERKKKHGGRQTARATRNAITLL